MRSFAQKAPQPTSDTRRPPPVAQNVAMSPIQQLQRRVGNQALQRMLQAHAGKAKDDARDAPLRIQPKLTVNTPGDVHEQEADRVAGQVMRMPEPQVQRACDCGGGCSIGRTTHDDGERVRTRSVQTSDIGETAAPPIVHDVLRSSGQSLDATTRAFMEPRFGHDFGHVRVHTDPKAAESAKAINATAYTVGRDVVFAQGEYQPGTVAGKRLLAHELTHVAQQTARSRPAALTLARQPANPGVKKPTADDSDKKTGSSAPAKSAAQKYTDIATAAKQLGNWKISGSRFSVVQDATIVYKGIPQLEMLAGKMDGVQIPQKSLAEINPTILELNKKIQLNKKIKPVSNLSSVVVPVLAPAVSTPAVVQVLQALAQLVGEILVVLAEIIVDILAVVFSEIVVIIVLIVAVIALIVWICKKIYEFVSVEAERLSKEAYCWSEYMIDIRYCDSLRSPASAAACKSQAMERYAACLRNKAIPPLPFP